MKNIFAATALAIAFSSPALYAYEETKELMVITFEDGRTAEFEVADIAKVNFENRVYTTEFSITSGEAEPEVYSAVPTLFRVIPTESGYPTLFGFGPTEAETPAGFRAGKYAVELSVAPSVLYTSNVDLSTASESVLVTLYEYDSEGAVLQSWTGFDSGKLTTAINPRNGMVTIDLTANLSDGPEIYASFTRKPVDTESLDELNPAPVYFNELVYFNMDGAESLRHNITGVTRSTYHNLPMFTFEFAEETETTTLVIDESLFGKDVFVPDVEAPATAYDDALVQIRYANIQIASTNSMYRPIATNAFVKVVENGDGTWTFDIDATNTYLSSPTSTTVGGTPERFVLNFTGEVKTK